MTRRTALVTGGTRGLGAAIASRLAGDGLDLILVGRDPERTRSAADALGAVGHAVDLGAPDAIDTLFDRLADREVDVLVNNAGISGNGPSDTMPADRIDEILDTNLRAPLLLATRMAGRMAADSGGRIVNVSSALATRGTPGTAIYAATKGGLVAATRALAAEFGPQGVRVNAIEPAITRSDMTAAELDDAALAHYLQSVPLRRMGEAEDIAALASFLAGPSGDYVTGQVIAVDGGWSTTSGPLFPTSAA
ncbi:SDR family NAD(P)-dependent oxidoreductase [Curtobacterium pusillum]|uniref:SDR family NAD(P)-dependent oxidoreductase n=1 Tax=Curtobacterium pusillum TaxID=69373 RepID=UPI0038231D45